MFTKSIASVVLVLASVAACGVPVETDEPEDVSTGSQSSALSPRDDVPAPLDYPVPSLEHPFERPIWDLEPYIQQPEPQQRLGGCVLYWIKLFDPSRGQPIDVPVVNCR